MLASLPYAAILLLVGGVIGFFASRSLRRSLYLLKKGMRATGHYKGDKRVEFTTAEGTRLTIAVPQKFPLGKEVRVLYDANRPSVASVESLWSLIGASGVRICIVLGMFVGAIVTLLASNPWLGGFIALIVLAVAWLLFACFYSVYASRKGLSAGKKSTLQ
jgi:hypothetical protein